MMQVVALRVVLLAFRGAVLLVNRLRWPSTSTTFEPLLPDYRRILRLLLWLLQMTQHGLRIISITNYVG